MLTEKYVLYLSYYLFCYTSMSAKKETKSNPHIHLIHKNSFVNNLSFNCYSNVWMKKWYEIQSESLSPVNDFAVKFTVYEWLWEWLYQRTLLLCFTSFFPFKLLWFIFILIKIIHKKMINKTNIINKTNDRILWAQNGMSDCVLPSRNFCFEYLRFTLQLHYAYFTLYRYSVSICITNDEKNSITKYIYCICSRLQCNRKIETH